MRERVLVLCLASWLAACTSGSSGEASSGAPTAGPSGTGTATSDPWSAHPVGWSAFAAPPRDLDGAAWLWTGDEVLTVGGCRATRTDCRAQRIAYAFDPAASAWTAISSPPVDLSYSWAVWTGAVAIFLRTSGRGPIDGAAYDPATGTWRKIAPAPIERANGGDRVWTGDRLLVWGGGDRGSSRATEGASYDPTSDAWHRIADAPIALNAVDGVWTGDRMVVVGSLLSRANRAPTPTAVAEAYDPASDSWTELPPTSLSPQATSAVWLDRRLVVWDYDARWQVYDPATERWSPPSRMPLQPSECYPDSTVVAGSLFAWFCGQAALLRQPGSTWERVRGGPLADTVHSKAYGTDLRLWRFADLVPSGSVLVMRLEGITLNHRGVACYGCAGSPTAYAVYRPSTG